LRASWGLTDDDMVVGHLGRYHPVKDHDSFLRAFAGAAARLPRLRAVLAGAGIDDRNAPLSARVRDLGIVDRVVMLGERRDVAALREAIVGRVGLGPEALRTLGHRARARIADRFTIALVARQYADLYAQLASSAHGRSPQRVA